MKMFVIGDTHGTIEINKLNSKNFPEGAQLTKEDYVVVCGDFGLLWNGSNEDKWWLNWLENKPWTTLFVDGNHENFELLESFPVEEWNGGKVHKVRPSIIHLMRGQVFNLNDIKIFSMGGAQSHDKWCRVEGRSWWSREMPSTEEMREAVVNLEKADWRVDMVFTHCAPTSLLPFLGRSFEPDGLTSFLDYVADDLRYTKWFFGHYHQDACLGREQCVYKEIIQVL